MERGGPAGHVSGLAGAGGSRLPLQATEATGLVGSWTCNVSGPATKRRRLHDSAELLYVQGVPCALAALNSSPCCVLHPYLGWGAQLERQAVRNCDSCDSRVRGLSTKGNTALVAAAPRAPREQQRPGVSWCRQHSRGRLSLCSGKTLRLVPPTTLACPQSVWADSEDDSPCWAHAYQLAGIITTHVVDWVTLHDPLSVTVSSHITHDAMPQQSSGGGSNHECPAMSCFVNVESRYNCFHQLVV
jgi:hypothetical protein